MKLAKKDNYDNALTADQVDKIGNALVFLSTQMKPLFKTKALKLLYFIEEFSIRKYGTPFFGIDFQLWSLGPVVRDVYIDLTSQSNPVLFKDFIETKSDVDSTVIFPKCDFNDDEFSDCDMQILDVVCETFKNTSGNELIELTHRDGFPWKVTAKQHGVLEDLETSKRLSTNIIIDMSILLEDSPTMKNFYLETMEFERQKNLLKS